MLLLCSYCLLAVNNKIAVLIPESGDCHHYGFLQYQGYKLAEIGSQNCEIRYFDIGSASGANLLDLINTKVLKWTPDIIIGPYSSKKAKEIMSYIKSSNIPLIIPTATLDSLTKEADNNVFRIATPAGILVDKVIEYIKKNNVKAKGDVYICLEDSVFARGFADMLQSSALRCGMKIQKPIFYKSGDVDNINKQININANTFLAFLSRSVEDCKKVTSQYGKKSNLIGLFSGFATNDFSTFLKREKENITIISPWNKNLNNPEIVSFIELFESKYNDAFAIVTPGYHNVQAYTALKVALNALDSNNPNIISSLSNTNLNTPLGKIQFVDYGGYYRQCTIYPVMKKYINGDDVSLTSNKTNISAKKNKNNSFFLSILNNQLIALFIILALGLLLGRFTVAGLSFAEAGVLFVALVFGHFHFTIPAGLGTFGLILFIYCVGISAGPNFFKAFASQGVILAKLSILTVALGGLITYLFVCFLDVPLDLAIGLFAGALTSTPALASGIDALKGYGDLVPVGYGIAYPFGVIGVVLFVQLLPRLLKKDLSKIDDSEGDDKKDIIERIVVKIKNPAIIGKKLDSISFLHSGNCVVSRIFDGSGPLPITHDTILEENNLLLLVGTRKNLPLTIDLIGELTEHNYLIDVEQERTTLIVLSSKLIDKSIKNLDILKNHKIVVTRIKRGDATFIPSRNTKFKKYDIITVAGRSSKIKAFSSFIEHKEKALQTTDIYKICIALILGIILGKMPIALPGGKTIMLGLAGGPLFVALLLSYFKKAGHFPTAARNFVQTLGLILFLANAGVRAGSKIVPVLQEYGASLFLYGSIITIVPMLITFTLAYKFLKIDLLEALGGVCGGMTSTPALGAITSKTDSIRPVTSYAVAYPVALILMTIAVQIIVSIFV